MNTGRTRREADDAVRSLLATCGLPEMVRLLSFWPSFQVQDKIPPEMEQLLERLAKQDKS